MQRYKNFEKLYNDFDIKLIQNSEIRVFKSGIPQKSFTVDVMSWIHSLGAPKRISSSIGPILQRCENFEKLGNVFDMKLFQNSEIRVFKSVIPQKSSTVENMSWIHSLGPSTRISSNIGPILQRCKNFEKLGIIFDMKLIETVKYVFQIGVPKKVFHCGYYVLDTLSRSPKRISSIIGPIWQNCRIFEKNR